MGSLTLLNLIFVKESYRNKGFASQALSFWEADMKRQGYQMVLVSTQADERAQFLYRKCGYIDCGALFFYDTPMDQPTELFFQKKSIDAVHIKMKFVRSPLNIQIKKRTSKACPFLIGKISSISRLL